MNREDFISPIPQDSLPWLEVMVEEVREAALKAGMFRRVEDLTQEEFEAAVEMHYTTEEQDEPW